MTAIDTPPKLRKAPIFTPYVLMWSTMGALSLGLLAVIGLAPEWLADLRPGFSTADPQSNQGQRAAMRLAADVATVKQSLAQVQLELAKVQTELTSNSEQQKSVVAQVTSLETRVASPAVTAAASSALSDSLPLDGRSTQSQTLRGYPTDGAIAPASVAKPVMDLAAAPAVIPTSVPPSEQGVSPPAAPKIINADVAGAAPERLETGSVATPAKLQTAASAVAAAKVPTEAISFGPATVKAAPKPIGIKVSSGSSVDSLRLSWSLLSEKHGDTLKAMQPRYIVSGDPQNPTYDLVAGPVKSKAEAKKVCKSLSDQGVSCSIGAFAGDNL